jgi:iron complex outermembrane recepter protein
MFRERERTMSKAKQMGTVSVLGMSAIVASCLASVSTGALAQAAPAAAPIEAETDMPGEILVTAQRRSESIQRVPVAVTSLSSEDLARANASVATDIVTRVPSLRFIELGGSVVNYNIRGVSQNDFTDHLEPPIALYVDDSYLSTATQAGLPIFDLQRVEVLRGPQGTLFGRNATGGLIQFISNQPTKTFESYVDLTLADDFWGKLEGAVSGPLSDNVQARLAFSASTREGYVKNNGPDGGSLGGENYVAARGIIAIQPSEDMRIQANVRYYNNFNQHGAPYAFAPTIANAQGVGRFVGPNENPYGTCNGCSAAFYGSYKQPDPYSGSYSTLGNFSREAIGGTFKIEQDIGALTISSISDYQHLTKSYFEDVDAAPARVIFDGHDQKLDQFTQELRLAGDSPGVRWSTGLYYYQQKSVTVNRYDVLNGFLTPSGTANIKTKSYSAYGQADVDLTSTVSMTLGARYTRDNKNLDLLISDPASGLPTFHLDRTTYPGIAKKGDDLYSGRIGLQWKPTARMMVYASASRGVKGGSYSLPYFLPVEVNAIPFAPETLYAYEIGEKWSSDDGAVRINVSGFYYDYKNYQGFVYATQPSGNPTGTIFNLPATSKGLEAEVQLRPTDRLSLGFNGALLDTNVKGVGLPNKQIVERDLPQAPSFSGNASVRYEVPASSKTTAAIQFNVAYSGAQSLTLLASPDELEKAYATGDLRLSLSSDDKSWEAAIFAKNIWNEKYRIFAYDLSAFGTIAQSYNRPRTVGVSLRRNFR